MKKTLPINTAARLVILAYDAPGLNISQAAAALHATYTDIAAAKTYLARRGWTVNALLIALSDEGDNRLNELYNRKMLVSFKTELRPAIEASMLPADDYDHPVIANDWRTPFIDAAISFDYRVGQAALQHVNGRIELLPPVGVVARTSYFLEAAFRRIAAAQPDSLTTLNNIQEVLKVLKPPVYALLKRTLKGEDESLYSTG